MRMNSNVHKFEQKGELNWILKKLFLSNTEYRVCPKERARLWHMFPFSSSTPQPTARCKGLSRVQCSPFSTNHSTERNAVRDLTEREILLKKISTYEFAALDLQIYLDTHPHDTAMIQKMNGFKEKLKPLVEEYEEKFGPLKKSMTSTNMWSWIKGPWPWENEEDC
mgnify:FL=1